VRCVRCIVRRVPQPRGYLFSEVSKNSQPLGTKVASRRNQNHANNDRVAFLLRALRVDVRGRLHTVPAVQTKTRTTLNQHAARSRACRVY
jgi:hypothetical protein